eukprot:gene12957-8813_t
MFSLKDRGLGLITSELLFRVIMAATHQITAQQPRIREEAKGKLSSSGSDELFVVNLSHHARSTHAQPPADPVRNASALVLGSKAKIPCFVCHHVRAPTPPQPHTTPHSHTKHTKISQLSRHNVLAQRPRSRTHYIRTFVSCHHGCYTPNHSTAAAHQRGSKGKLSSSGSDELFVVNLSHHARSTHAQPPADPLCHLNAPWRDATIIISAVRAPAHAAHPDPGKLS